MADTVPIPREWLQRLEDKLDQALTWQHKREGQCACHDRDIDDHEARMRALEAVQIGSLEDRIKAHKERLGALEAVQHQALGGWTVTQKLAALLAFAIPTAIAAAALWLK